MNPSPEGVPGELYIGGAGLARGYQDRPDLTAERFVPDPFGDEAGGRLCKTGDLVRVQDDGSLVFLKRLDHQVKVRGHRIELGEIESVLAQHPSLREAAVVLRKDEANNPRIVAYVVPVPDEQVPAGEVRQYLRQRLPEYMVPSFVVTLDALPRTSSAKIDRRALPKPEQAERASTTAYAAPRTAVEELLSGMWAELLHVQRVGVTENFFNELGGHSLLATQLVSRVRELFGIALPLQRIFEAPTIETFAGVLADSDEERIRLEQMAALFLKVESLPEDELDRLLSSTTAGRAEEV